MICTLQDAKNTFRSCFVIFVFLRNLEMYSCHCLLQNRTEARRVIQGSNPPRNCTCAFSKEGDQIFTNRLYTSDQTRPRFLSGDVEEEIRCVFCKQRDSFCFSPVLKSIPAY